MYECRCNSLTNLCVGSLCSLPHGTSHSCSDRVLNSTSTATSSTATASSKECTLYTSALRAASTVCNHSLTSSCPFHSVSHYHHGDHFHIFLLLSPSDAGVVCRLCLQDVWSQSRCVGLLEIKEWAWVFMKYFWLSLLFNLFTAHGHMAASK